MDDSIKHIAYFPGCSLKSSAAEYDVSIQLVCKHLKIKLEEIQDWICCGASSAHTMDRVLGLSLPAASVTKAADQYTSMVVPCAMCFSRLKTSQKEMKNTLLREKVEQALGHIVKTDISILSVLDFLSQQSSCFKIEKTLNGLSVACYYGCLLVRPPTITNPDNAEHPKTMEKVIEKLGACSVPWGLPTFCCGASLAIPKKGIVQKLTEKILDVAQAAGAECMAVACPMCQANLDMYQKKTSLPVFYVTQLVALAFGEDPKNLGLEKHFVDPIPLLKKKNLL